MTRSIVFGITAGLLLLAAVRAFAGVEGANIPSVQGTTVLFETNDTHAMNAIIMASNDTAGGADTGADSCALVGMDCYDAWTLDAGQAADELSDITCSTDVPNGTLALVACY